MRNLCFYILIISISASCLSQKEKINYKLINDDGIYVEEFDSTVVALNKFTLDNKVYIRGNTYTFDYHFINNNGEKLKFIAVTDDSSLGFIEKGLAWQFIAFDSNNENLINQIELVVDTNSNHILYRMPGYNQSIISYYYLQKNGIKILNESTGLIENIANVWMHPPRQKLFRILELNPFPFIKSPYKVGNTWEWSMKIGDSWADPRWKEWKGEIQNMYKYEIVTQKNIKTSFGDVKCFQVEAESINKLGNSYLTAFYNKDIGFVKLEYTNIDSTKLILELVKIE